MSIPSANAVPINFKKLGGIASAGARAHATSRDKTPADVIAVSPQPNVISVATGKIDVKA